MRIQKSRNDIKHLAGAKGFDAVAMAAIADGIFNLLASAVPRYCSGSDLNKHCKRFGDWLPRQANSAPMVEKSQDLGALLD